MDKQSAIINMVMKIENEALIDKLYDIVKRLYRKRARN